MLVERRQRLQAQWRRRSTLIRRLRRILPAIGAALLLALVAWTVNGTLASRLSASRQNGDLVIRLLRPRYQGRDESGRPYVLSAESAVRDNFDSARVTLTAPVFSLGSAAQGQTVLHARTGVYREDTRILDLTGQVRLDDAGGMHFVTEHARVDMLTNNVDGEQHVAGNGPLGRIVASAYAVREGGGHVFFNGQVKTHIVHPGASVTAQPAAVKR